MLARSRLPNLDEKRLRTNSQVLTVFFFGVGLVVLQMEIDCLGYFHGAPPVVGVGGKTPYPIVPHDPIRLTGAAQSSGRSSGFVIQPKYMLASGHLLFLRDSMYRPRFLKKYPNCNCLFSAVII